MRPRVRPETDPANELFYGAAELLAASKQMQAAAAVAGVAAAIPASIGCIEAALDGLGKTIERLRHEASSVLVNQAAVVSPHREMASPVDVERYFHELASMIFAARSACARVRHRVGPTIAEAAA
jgi:hypothetical protein